MDIVNAIEQIKEAQKEGLEACISLLREGGVKPAVIDDVEMLTSERLKDISVIPTLTFAGLSGEKAISDEAMAAIKYLEKKLAEEICWKYYYEISKGRA